jgi:hypothetical protein
MRRQILAMVILLTSVSLVAAAQQAPQRAGAAGTPRAAAPLDLEGTWVSVVTEDWRWRMLTPPRGEAPGVPLSVEGRKLADAWDLERDNATGQQCKAYGAGGIMRIPGRVRITWQDDHTLRLDFDAGKQTRLIRFASAGAAQVSRPEPSLQGTSVGAWQVRNTGAPIIDEGPPPAAPVATGAPTVLAVAPRGKGSLKVVTTNLRAGYFRKNGLPYGEQAVLTEYFDRHEDFGSQWFTVLSVLEDSRHLLSPFVTTTHFKREPDGSKFNPQPCETLPPTAPRSRGEVG